MRSLGTRPGQMEPEPPDLRPVARQLDASFRERVDRLIHKCTGV
jgi:hypothetical protein